MAESEDQTRRIATGTGRDSLQPGAHRELRQKAEKMGRDDYGRRQDR